MMSKLQIDFKLIEEYNNPDIQDKKMFVSHQNCRSSDLDPNELSSCSEQYNMRRQEESQQLDNMSLESNQMEEVKFDQ